MTTVGAVGNVTIWSWSIDPPLVILFDFAILYWVGSWRTVAPRRTTVERRWRTVSFLLGLLVVAIAIDSPLELKAESLFWAHMVQHVLLLTVAPPLIVLSRPWIRLWRPLPLGLRKSVAGGLARGGWAAPLRRLSRALGAPLPTFILFSGVLIVWHLPFMFNATLHSTWLHVAEHTMFFATALMFWKQVIPSPPLRIYLNEPQRVAYLTGAMIVGWMLAVVLALWPRPLYPFYALEARPPGAISAIGDQHLAAGVMWVLGSATFTIAIFVYLYRWLAPPESARLPALQIAGSPPLPPPAPITSVSDQMSATATEEAP